ncbi:glycerophosphodiester phosphodiesterase [Kaistia adipata]|uniref:glycerophosphodiester phosphodiesterase n=1 Tax=Kaistia adipata TaxID=166954 RepID=UPI000A00DFDC|nr:glycerophosphodiester phosphodiesterase family protein [Kaistia adipata]
MLELLPSRSGRILLCGHRGHSVDGHENTRPALQQAAELGASLCEIDLRRTRDGRLVVFHDDILDNASTGKGLISQLDYDDIAPFRTRARNGQAIAGQPIEPFEAILAYCRDLGLGLIVEIKDKVAGPGYLEPVVAAIEAAGMTERVLISSFDYVVLRDIKAIAPSLRTMGINYHRLVDAAGAARSATMDVLNTDYPQFAPDIADSLHEAGIGVSHFVPQPAHFALRKDYGVDHLDDLAAHLRAGRIDMLVCDDVRWGFDLVARCGREVVRLDPPDRAAARRRDADLAP